MAAILGEESIQDVKGWISRAVDEVKAYVSAELHRQITQQYLDELSDSVNGMLLDLMDYDVARDERILTAQFGRMNTLITATKRFGQPTVFLYANVISLRMTVLSALVRNHGRKRYAPLIESTAADAQATIGQRISENLAWLDEGVSGVTPCRCGDAPPTGYGCWIFSRVGRELAVSEHYQVAEGRCAGIRAARVDAFQAERLAGIERIHVPLGNIVAARNKAVQESKK